MFLLFFGSLSLVQGQVVDTTFLQQRIQEASSLIREGDFKKAEKMLRKDIRQYAQQLSEYPRLLSMLYHKMGVLHYSSGDSENNFRQALQNFRKALLIRQQKLPANDPDLLNSYYVLFVLCNYFDKTDLAQQYGQSAANLLEKQEEPPIERLTALYLQMSRLYNKKGDATAAATFARKAIRLAQQTDDEYSLLQCHTELGFAYETQKKYRQAFDAHQKSLDLARQMEGVDEWVLGNCYNNLGLLFKETGRHNEAIEHLTKSMEINKRDYRQSRDSYTHLNLADNYENIGTVYIRQGKFDKALAYTKRSQNILQKELKTRYHADIAKCQANFGDIYEGQGKLNKALRTHQMGIQALVPDFRSKKIADNPTFSQQRSNDRPTLLQLMASKARVFFKKASGSNDDQAYLQRALNTHLALDTLITQMRQSYQAAGSRYQLIEDVVPIYENAIDICLNLYEQSGEKKYLEKAYYFCAKNKAIVLLEGMHDEYSKEFSGIPTDLLDKERSLKKSAHELESTLYELQAEQKLPQTASLEDSLFAIKRQYQKLIEQFEREFPAYYQLKYAFQSPNSIDDVQKQLADDQILLEYFIGPSQAYVFSISSQTIFYHRLELSDSFAQDCRTFRALLDSGLDFSEETFSDLSHQLYQQLLNKPLIDHRRNNQIRRLLIIPDQLLLQISFDVLLTSKTKPKRIPKPYLIRRYAISYAYSNQLAFDKTASDRVQQAIERFIGFGLEYDDYTLEGVNGLKKSNGDSLLPERSIGRLIYSDDEVAEIADLFNGKTWLNQDATKETFLKNAPSAYLLHLAMHGIVEEDNPLNTALIFTRTSDSIDYLLKPADLYSTRLHSELVTLSACNSAYGDIKSGEGIRSLSRAFTYAGCPSLVASLWSASDISTKQIMLPFYENLRQGMPKDVALQKAKLVYMETTNPAYAIPGFWSHLILIGKTDPLQLPPQSWPWKRFFLLVLLAGVLFYALQALWQRMR
ncbi:MAG: CHAT domain-containing tetratricopeptide repeat protein [Bacteroidota bacterium]